MTRDARSGQVDDSFIANFLTGLECEKSKRVFWCNIQDIHDKIKSVFCDVNGSLLSKGLIIQFWAPAKSIRYNGEKWLLSTLDQPFALDLHDYYLHQYRKWCSDYSSRFGVVPVMAFPTDDEYPNYYPLIVPDLRLLQEAPMRDEAINCGFTSSIWMPVFFHPKTSLEVKGKKIHSYCVGVVECCMKLSDHLLTVFNELKRAIKSVGLTTFHVPYTEFIPKLKYLKDGIEDALKIVSELHNIYLAQVWIPIGESENHVPCSSSSLAEKMFVVKLCGHCVQSDNKGDFSLVVKDYYDTCDVIPWRMGIGLVGKTLKTHQHHFVRNVSKLSDNMDGANGILGLLSGYTKCSCAVICLRNSDTGLLDYAFEFLWPQSRYHLVVLESLILTLKKFLPSFIVENTGEVVDVCNFTETGNKTFKILQDNKLSPIPKELVEGTTSRVGNLNELSETEDVGMTDSDSEVAFWEEEEEENEEEEDMIIIAIFNEVPKRIITRTSETLANARQKIMEKFNLDHGIFTMKYEFQGGSVILDTDENWSRYIKHWRDVVIKNGEESYIAVYVSTP